MKKRRAVKALVIIVMANLLAYILATDMSEYRKEAKAIVQKGEIFTLVGYEREEYVCMGMGEYEVKVPGWIVDFRKEGIPIGSKFRWEYKGGVVGFGATECPEEYLRPVLVKKGQ